MGGDRTVCINSEVLIQWPIAITNLLRSRSVLKLKQPNIAQEVLKMSKTDSAEELGGGALNISGKQLVDIVQLLTVQKPQEGNSDDQADGASSLPPSTATTTTSSAAKKVYHGDIMCQARGHVAS